MKHASATVIERLIYKTRRERGEEAARYISMRYHQLKAENNLTVGTLKEAITRTRARYPARPAG